MPAAETTNAVPKTRIVTIGRQARAELSSLRLPFKRLVSVRGATTLGLAACYACAALTSLVKIMTQLECDSKKPPAPFDASRDRFVDIAGNWFGLNVAVALLLATADAGCGDGGSRFVHEPSSKSFSHTAAPLVAPASQLLCASTLSTPSAMVPRSES